VHSQANNTGALALGWWNGRIMCGVVPFCGDTNSTFPIGLCVVCRC